MFFAASNVAVYRWSSPCLTSALMRALVKHAFHSSHYPLCHQETLFFNKQNTLWCLLHKTSNIFLCNSGTLSVSSLVIGVHLVGAKSQSSSRHFLPSLTRPKAFCACTRHARSNMDDLVSASKSKADTHSERLSNIIRLWHQLPELSSFTETN